MLIVRNLRECDFDSTLTLRNNEDDLVYYLNSKRVSIGNHQKWFSSRMEMNQNFTVVADYNGEFAGISYISEPQTSQIEISIRVVPKYRGLGIATKLLSTLEKNLEDLVFERLLARVHSQNIKSIRFFEGNGYKKKKEILDEKFIELEKIF